MPVIDDPQLVSVYAPRSLIDAIRARAAAEDRSFSSTVRHAMRQYLGDDAAAERAADGRANEGSTSA